MSRITMEMIDNYHQEVGEDFIDQNEHLINGEHISCIMVGHNPSIATRVFEEMTTHNKSKLRYSIQDTMEIYRELYPSDQLDEIFYKQFIWAVNLTEHTKNRLIKILKENEQSI